MIPHHHEFCDSARIVLGAKVIEHTGYELASQGASRPLVLANTQLRELKVATVVLDAPTHTVESFSCVQANPLCDYYARLALADAALLVGAAFSNVMVGIASTRHAAEAAARGAAGRG